MAKLDISDAYKHIRVRSEDWDLLGVIWITPEGQKQYYVDLTLPFGLRSSAKKFTDFAEALAYIMRHNGVSHVEQYLDDFVTWAPTREECMENLHIMLRMCEAVGFAVNPGKTVKPTTCLEYLGTGGSGSCMSGTASAS